MKKITINTEYITLGQMLKMTSLISSGGEAKYYLFDNNVYVNNEEEGRRGRKLYPNDVIKINDKEFIIIHA